jgi:predicted phosphodiesterase
MRYAQVMILSLIIVEAAIGRAHAHDGPDPVARWEFSQRQLDGETLRAKTGPDASIVGRSRIVEGPQGEDMVFTQRMRCVVAEDYKTVVEKLPTEAMTVTAWVAIDEPEENGGIIGVVEDNGNTERGWSLGYNKKHFTFVLSTSGADDGDGVFTRLIGKTEWRRGRLYHVAAVFDGKVAELYVNGVLEASSDAQSGKLLYPSKGQFVIGSFHDQNEDYRLVGRLHEIKLFDQAAKDIWVRTEFDRDVRLASLEAMPVSSKDEFVVPPYLQFGTQTSMTVMWRTARPGTTTVYFGDSVEMKAEKAIDGLKEIHEVKLDGLEPETQYFYSVATQFEDGSRAESDVFTFSTAVHPHTPFAFAVMGDTQGNPEVSGKLSEMAWAQRPNFVVHAGDLVDKGSDPKHWTEHFFPGMKPLIERVPFYPVIGNHEENSRNYYDYVSLPDPEYFYKFSYGNAEFFMIDSNKNLDPESEQYKWLKQALSESNATWKIAMHHHPPFSSDGDDYGNLWKTRKSTRGDLRARQLAELYDEFKVDVVWNGHIHSYERTWPIRRGKAVETDGTIYMITGGAGGGLETAGPFRPFFTNNVKHGHHYCMVFVNGGTFELRSFDLEGRLFDTVTLSKTVTQAKSE